MISMCCKPRSQEEEREKRDMERKASGGRKGVREQNEGNVELMNEKNERKERSTLKTIKKEGYIERQHFNCCVIL